MGIVHKFKGERESFEWEEVAVKEYDSTKEVKGVTRRILIGDKEKAPYFVMRYFEIEPGGWTVLDKHPHDHGVMIIRGKGKVLLGEREINVGLRDVIYVPPNEVHQFKNTGEEPFGFICVIPNKDLLRKVKT
jgi:quercetin dioxygenase-like cupin family protein